MIEKLKFSFGLIILITLLSSSLFADEVIVTTPNPTRNLGDNPVWVLPPTPVPLGICGAAATCQLVAKTGVEFFVFLSKCLQLGGASISWQTTKTMNLAIAQGKKGGCLITVRNTLYPEKPHIATCELTPTQVQNMTTKEVLTAVQQFDQTHVRSQFLDQATKPISDCLGTVIPKHFSRTLQGTL